MFREPGRLKTNLNRDSLPYKACVWPERASTTVYRGDLPYDRLVRNPAPDCRALAGCAMSCRYRLQRETYRDMIWPTC